MRWAARGPRAETIVVTSDRILVDRLPVTLLVRWNTGSFTLLSGYEEVGDTPRERRFDEVVGANLWLYTVRVRLGQYALRGVRRREVFMFGPLSDGEIESAMTSGQVDEQLRAIDD